MQAIIVIDWAEIMRLDGGQIESSHRERNLLPEQAYAYGLLLPVDWNRLLMNELSGSCDDASFIGADLTIRDRDGMSKPVFDCDHVF